MGGAGRARGWAGGAGGRGAPRGAVAVARVSSEAGRATAFQVREGRGRRPGLAVEEYLQDVDRVVCSTFPDASRRKKLGVGRWEVTLLSQNFFTFSFEPVTVIESTYDLENGALCIKVDQLDLRGLPASIVNSQPRLEVRGRLRPAQPASEGEFRQLTGRVSMKIDFDLPMQFMLLPGVSEVVQGILESILNRMESNLQSYLPQDFITWQQEQADAQKG